jgi:hypothetical protein
MKILRHAAYTRDLSKAFDALPPEQKKVFESMLQNVEPLAVAPALKERAQEGQVLMINANKDEIIPREATLALAEALGIAPNIVWMDGEHCTVSVPKVVDKIAAFFEKDLAPHTGDSAAANPPAAKKIAAVTTTASHSSK